MGKKEWVLNMAFNRWQLNRPKYVGRLSEAIRACAPRSLEEWREYYFAEVPNKHVPKNWQMLGNSMKSHLRIIGERLYVKINEQLRSELEAITEEDCIRYVEEVVIIRTFEGYQRERETIYGQLQQYLHEKGLDYQIHPAPAEWEGRYHVDFYIVLSSEKSHYLGIQIKPITYEQFFAESHKWRQQMQKAQEHFTKQYRGKVFIIFYYQKDRNKVIINPEFLEKIRAEIQRVLLSEER